MSSSDAGNPTFWPTVQIPDDTDAWDASSYAPGLTLLTDRTVWLGQFDSTGSVFPSAKTWGVRGTGEGGTPTADPGQTGGIFTGGTNGIGVFALGVGTGIGAVVEGGASADWALGVSGVNSNPAAYFESSGGGLAIYAVGGTGASGASFVAGAGTNAGATGQGGTPGSGNANGGSGFHGTGGALSGSGNDGAGVIGDGGGASGTGVKGNGGSGGAAGGDGGSFAGGSPTSGTFAGGVGVRGTGGAGYSTGTGGTGGVFTGGTNNGVGSSSTGVGTGAGGLGQGGSPSGGNQAGGVGFVGTGGPGSGSGADGAGLQGNGGGSSGVGVVGYGASGATSGAGGQFFGGAPGSGNSDGGSGLYAIGGAGHGSGADGHGIHAIGGGSAVGGLFANGTDGQPAVELVNGPLLLSSPVSGSPIAHGLYPENMVIAWAQIVTDGSGGVGLHGGFNVDSNGLSVFSTGVSFNLLTGIASGSNPCAVANGTNDAGGGPILCTTNVSPGTLDQQVVCSGVDPTSQGCSFYIIIMGKQ